MSVLKISIVQYAYTFTLILDVCIIADCKSVNVQTSVQKWLFIFRECILRRNYYLLLLFISVLFDLPIEIACGPFPLFPTKEQQPQGLSEIRDR